MRKWVYVFAETSNSDIKGYKTFSDQNEASLSLSVYLRVKNIMNIKKTAFSYSIAKSLKCRLNALLESHYRLHFQTSFENFKEWIIRPNIM